jgi:tRNA pseudouridine65 synthase
MSSEAEAIRSAPLRILYDDTQLIAVDKPAWSVVHPTRGARDALVIVQALAAAIDAPLFPIHRLDRQTSGVLLFAKSAESASTLSVELREGRAQKSYLGLCRGVIAEELHIDHPVREGTARRPASTDVEPLEHLCGRYTLVRARPRTGRRHQIRYHLKHVNHPLVVDTLYGKGDLNRFFREQFGLRRLFLHAESLTILHPVEPRRVQIHSPLPAELERILECLRVYSGPVV